MPLSSRRKLVTTSIWWYVFAFVVLLSPAMASNSSEPIHWAFRPIDPPAVPGVKNTAWPQNTIDCFILARLEAAGLQPVGSASPKDLRRRIYFDLIGLPPSPDSQDEQPTAKPNSAIDRLLGSPDYGSRWGRHWLDVVRYADSNGLDENAAHANAWRYRDYVVDSFNEDKPFDQFLKEQIAGDLLPAGSESQRRAQYIATGFLSLGPKVLAEPDKVKMEMDIIDEQIGTVGQAFLGITLGCARCHDHKFDPITMEDYYALAGIFKSTKTMESFATIAKWHENSVAAPRQEKLYENHQTLLSAQTRVIEAFTAKANQALLVELDTDQLPSEPEEQYPSATKEELKKLRDTLERLKSQLPSRPMAMGVADGEVADLPVFVRGDHNSPGEPQQRRFPVALVHRDPPPLTEDASGRLELAEWLAVDQQPLTSRVIVNRVWRWHFGKGLVPTTDNFGQLGQSPTHPKLLDWLAVWFTDNGWSIKKLNRLILQSATYQMASTVSAEALEKDPDNQLYSRAPLRRIEAESLRDTLLMISGDLDRQMEGSLWTFENYKLVFNHTSKDETTYAIDRRAIYLPIIRNHVYGMFELFDFPDPATVGGDRSSTAIAPQALFLMNSPLAMRATENLARKLLAHKEWDDNQRIHELYELAYHRPPTQAEQQQAVRFVERFTLARQEDNDEQAHVAAWQAMCQAVVASNEFMYLR